MLLVAKIHFTKNYAVSLIDFFLLNPCYLFSFQQMKQNFNLHLELNFEQRLCAVKKLPHSPPKRYIFNGRIYTAIYSC
jgi:hypothetical protein